MTAHHWRTIRLKLSLAGIENPMKMTSMHAVLDATEQAVMEAMASQGKDGESKLSMFQSKLYAPSPEGTGQLNGARYQELAESFENEEVEADFDAFMKASAAP